MALSDERIAELKEVALKIAPLHRSAARPFARSIEAEVRKEYEARIAELEAQLEAVGAQAVNAKRLTQAARDITTVLRVEGMDLEIGSRKLLKEARDAIDAAIAKEKAK